MEMEQSILVDRDIKASKPDTPEDDGLINNELSELNFDMNKDQVVQVLENNGCKIIIQ